MKFGILVFLILITNTIFAHPDGMKPYWYPSSYLYGFVNGCWQTVEQNEFLSKDMWPDDIKTVCGCVIDAVRHSIPFHEAEKRDPESNRKFDEITRGVLPVCISEQDEKIIQRKNDG